MWTLTRHFFRMVDWILDKYNDMVGWGGVSQNPSLDYWICRLLPLRPKWKVRIAMLSRRESESGPKSEFKASTERLVFKKLVLHVVESPDLCLRWLLTQRYAYAFKHSASSDNARRRNPTGQATRRRLRLYCGKKRSHSIMQPIPAEKCVPEKNTDWLLIRRRVISSHTNPLLALTARCVK